MPNKSPQGNLESVVEGIGTVDNELGGQLFTFLADTLSPLATTVKVDTTLGWPAIGRIQVGAETIDYTSKTDTTFVVTSRAPDATTAYRGTAVIDRSRIVNEVDSARSQLTYLSATGSYLRDLLGNHGLPRLSDKISDKYARAFGKVASYPEAGPMFMVAKGLDALLNGPLRYGAITTPNTITLNNQNGGFPDNFGRRLIKIHAPAANAGVYRVDKMSPKLLGQPFLIATLQRVGGTFYDGANFTSAEANVAVELMPFDVWEHPNEPCRFRVDLFKFSNVAGSAKGASYLQGAEQAISSAVNTVSTAFDIQQVLGVFLASDITMTGTNYYTGGSFNGKVITLGTNLPAANTSVLINYGAFISEGTAQVIDGPPFPTSTISGINQFPLYLTGTDPTLVSKELIDVIRAAGFLPIYNEYVL